MEETQENGNEGEDGDEEEPIEWPESPPREVSVS